LAMLLTVRDSSSASTASRWQSSSGSTTWMRGDLGRPLEEVWRVGTASIQLATKKCTETGKGSIQM
jgi:hypothetical protein